MKSDPLTTLKMSIKSLASMEDFEGMFTELCEAKRDLNYLVSLAAIQLADQLEKGLTGDDLVVTITSLPELSIDTPDIYVDEIITAYFRKEQMTNGKM